MKLRTHFNTTVMHTRAPCKRVKVPILYNPPAPPLLGQHCKLVAWLLVWGPAVAIRAVLRGHPLLLHLRLRLLSARRHGQGCRPRHSFNEGPTARPPPAPSGLATRGSPGVRSGRGVAHTPQGEPGSREQPGAPGHCLRGARANSRLLNRASLRPPSAPAALRAESCPPHLNAHKPSGGTSR